MKQGRHETQEPWAASIRTPVHYVQLHILHTHTCTYMSFGICICIYMHVHLCVCLHIYTHKHLGVSLNLEYLHNSARHRVGPYLF